MLDGKNVHTSTRPSLHTPTKLAKLVLPSGSRCEKHDHVATLEPLVPRGELVVQRHAQPLLVERKDLFEAEFGEQVSRRFGRRRHRLRSRPARLTKQGIMVEFDLSRASVPGSWFLVSGVDMLASVN